MPFTAKLLQIFRQKFYNIRQGQIWPFKLLHGEKMKIIHFSKTVAAYDFKVGRCIELNVLMKLHEYQRSRSLKSFFSKNVELFETKYHVKGFGSTEMKIYTNGLDHMTKLAATPIYIKKPSKIFFPRTCGPIAMELGM